MTSKAIFSSSVQLTELNIDSEALDAVRRCLLATGFELLEMREFDSGHIDEMWSDPASSYKVRLNITSPKIIEEQEVDASRSELVSEVIDLWFELRAIRNLLSDDLDEMLLQKEETPMERFQNFVQDFRTERENAPDTWRFMFSAEVDEAICAFNELKESDRLAILH